jgi:hypothetical protein
MPFFFFLILSCIKGGVANDNITVTNSELVAEEKSCLLFVVLLFWMEGKRYYLRYTVRPHVVIESRESRLTSDVDDVVMKEVVASIMALIS